MKQFKQKLSLLLVFLLMLSLTPSAFAAGENASDPAVQASGADNTIYTVTVDCAASIAPGESAEASVKVTYKDADNKTQEASIASVRWSSPSSAITFTPETTTKNTTTVSVESTATLGTPATIQAKPTLSNGQTLDAGSKTINISDGVVVTLSKASYTSGTVNLNEYISPITLEVSTAVKENDKTVKSSDYSVKYTWTPHNLYDNGSSTENKCLVYNGNRTLSNASVDCTATVTYNGKTYKSNTVTWNITNTATGKNFAVTVYDSNTGYALTDTPDEGSTSIAQQIDDWVRTNYRNYYNSSYYGYQVQFPDRGTRYENSSSSSAKGYLDAGSSWYDPSSLENVIFEPQTSVTSTSGSYKITYTISIRLYRSSTSIADETVTCSMTFTVKQGNSGGDINYSAGLGEDVEFKVSDFENFWNKLYSRGTLSHVTFGSVSGGTVYSASNKSVGSSSYYANPRNNQNDLYGVHFSPNSTTAKKATTIRIPFTAYGTTTASSTSNNNSRSGTIIITYLNDSAARITYSTGLDGKVTLKAQDFIDAYKKATGTSSNPSNLTIQFQGVPSNGSLDYKDSSKSSSSSVRLTGSNVKNYKFTTKTSGSNQLGDVTYTGSSTKTDTISYIGYIGNTATFTGEVVFNSTNAPQTTNVRVPFTCYTSAGVVLTPVTFTSASAAMAEANYIDLGAPASGTLINAITGMSAANSQMLLSQLSTVMYVPNSGVTSTTDTIIFTAYNVYGTAVASGTISVVVSLTPTVTDVYQFTDVASDTNNSWYIKDLNYLVSRGLITGKGYGMFGPKDSLRYSEALKMVMNAAGYTEKEVTDGTANWAQNYLNTAVSKGWISGTVDLNAYITRDAMAELSAKVLGLSSSNSTPFADSTNGWAAALYNAKILYGSGGSATTKPSFNGTKSLSRSEMVCIVSRMYTYTGK